MEEQLSLSPPLQISIEEEHTSSTLQIPIEEEHSFSPSPSSSARGHILPEAGSGGQKEHENNLHEVHTEEITQISSLSITSEEIPLSSSLSISSAATTENVARFYVLTILIGLIIGIDTNIAGAAM
ncbi:hypothetical protein SAY87_009435 [Trapa incisa]|uniref:Uncharacterized protein n=1 Tax=Trapa incisa TaxID=236973 RepID=A0AAN7K1P3_9MYRT|nr:hypothetical protein SAY87_009435 [Trapa incisa]